MPILPSKEDADITPGIFGYQCTSKFQLLPAGNSQTIYEPKWQGKKTHNLEYTCLIKGPDR